MSRQTTFVYCVCGFELCSGGVYAGPEDDCVETYTCAQCGARSRWLFAAPVPIRLGSEP